MTYRGTPRTAAGSALLTLCAASLLSSCSVKSSGGYLTGKGSTDLFEPLHATTAEILTPTLDNNYCFMRQAWQRRAYNTKERLVERNRKIQDRAKKSEYEFSNRCQ